MDQRHRQVFELIKKATRLHRANVDATMPSRPLYQGQIPIVFFIGNHPGCRLTDISEGLKITRAATTKSVNRLVNSGMVAKKADPEDQRICRVAITPKGRRCIASGRKAFEGTIDKAFDGFSAADMEAFAGYLQRIVDNLQPANDPAGKERQ